MKIPILEMRDLCKRILLSHRLTEDEATIIADDYLDAEMRGKPSHGLKAFSVVLEDSKSLQAMGWLEGFFCRGGR